MAHPARLRAPRTALLLVDTQQGSLPSSPESELILESWRRLILLAVEQTVPILVTELRTAGLGPTFPSIRQSLEDNDLPWEPVIREHYAAFDELGFLQRIQGVDRTQLILAGQPLHGAVLLTALGGLQRGYDIHLPLDALWSTPADPRNSARETLRQAGAWLTCSETIRLALTGQPKPAA